MKIPTWFLILLGALVVFKIGWLMFKGDER